MNLERIVDRTVRYKRKYPNAVIILDTSFLPEIPYYRGKYLLNSKIKKRKRRKSGKYPIIITSGVNKEIQYYSKHRKKDFLIPAKLNDFIYNYLKPEIIAYRPTNKEIKLIQRGIYRTCPKFKREVDKISWADLEQLGYAMHLSYNFRKPTILLTEDRHIYGPANWLNKKGWNVYAPKV